MAVRVTEHRCQRVRCPDCDRRSAGALPVEVAASAFGPRLQAAVVTLSVRNRISRRDVVELCEQLFHSRISAGTVDTILQRAGDALAEPYEDLLERVRTARAVNMDETGWRLRGGQRALWGAFTDRHAILRVERDRQAPMGWTDTHLHAFEAGGVDYGPVDPELDHEDERRTAIGDLLSEPRDRMRYVYDFGDYWQHDIVVEKVLAAERGTRYPVCLTGKGRRPPEDCGGVWGYADLREKLADPTHEEHADMLDWLGLETAAEFDAHAFDVDEVNVILGGRIGVA
jgi:hypothetical protein